MIPLLTDSIGQLLDQNNQDNAKDAASRDKIVCKNAIKQKIKEVLKLNRTINDTSLDALPDYDALKQIKQKRAILFEEIWELYCEAKGIEYIKPKDNKKVIDMTAEELEAVLKAVNSNRPQQTMNFYAPIGQQITHVDKIEAHFDKDMKMVITSAEEVADTDDLEESNKRKSMRKRVKPAAETTVRTREVFRLKNSTLPHMQLLWLYLSHLEWVSSEDMQAWLDLFGGEPSECVVIWSGKVGVGTLKELFARLIVENIIQPMNNYVSVIESHFKDKNGNYLSNVKGGKSNETTTAQIGRILPKLKRTYDITAGIDEDFGDIRYGQKQYWDEHKKD